LRKLTCCLIVVCLLTLASLKHGAAARAADARAGETTVEGAAGQTQSDSRTGVWEMLRASGLVGLAILLLSVAAVALVIEHVMTIRQAVLMPPGLGEEVRQLLAEGKLTPARQRCRAAPSFLAYVLEAGLAEADGGWAAVEKAMEDAAAQESARLFRKIEYLSVIGNIAPMLGLLGTVIGMVIAFREVADTQGAARAADLAEGIYLALVTTVEGLLVAIPSLAAFAVFRNRVDQLVAEVAYVVQHVSAPLKRGFAAGKSPSPQPPMPPPVGGH
jgi:biopolymer transport protein ExbB